jgi:hypothetical protein
MFKLKALLPIVAAVIWALLISCGSSGSTSVIYTIPNFNLDAEELHLVHMDLNEAAGHEAYSEAAEGISHYLDMDSRLGFNLINADEVSEFTSIYCSVYDMDVLEFVTGTDAEKIRESLSNNGYEKSEIEGVEIWTADDFSVAFLGAGRYLTSTTETVIEFINAQNDKGTTLNNEFAGITKIVNAVDDSPLFQIRVPGWRELEGKMRAVSFVVEGETSHVEVYDLYQNNDLSSAAVETVESQLNQMEESEYFENVSVEKFSDTVVLIRFEGVTDFSDIRL